MPRARTASSARDEDMGRARDAPCVEIAAAPGRPDDDRRPGRRNPSTDIVGADDDEPAGDLEARRIDHHRTSRGILVMEPATAPGWVAAAHVPDNEP